MVKLSDRLSSRIATVLMETGKKIQEIAEEENEPMPVENLISLFLGVVCGLAGDKTDWDARAFAHAVVDSAFVENNKGTN